MFRYLPILWSLTCGISTASACSCIGQDGIKQARKKADAVFLGKVISAEALQVSSSDTLSPFSTSLMRYTLVVERSFKGPKQGATIVVITGMGRGDCGYPFQVDRRYVVYGAREGGGTEGLPTAQPLRGKGIFWTDICTRTTGEIERELEGSDKWR